MIWAVLAGVVIGILVTVIQDIDSARKHRCTRGGVEHDFEEVRTEVESFPPSFDPNAPTSAVFADDVKLVREVYHGHVCKRCGKVVIMPSPSTSAKASPTA